MIDTATNTVTATIPTGPLPPSWRSVRTAPGHM
ncbi:hypothetical protein [Streptomyces caniferus]|nr:hypothetical protein [Streptomyces caniferus]